MVVGTMMKQQNPHINQSKVDETVEKIGKVLFYITITGVGMTALMNIGHVGPALKVVESVALTVKGYEIGAVVVGLFMWSMVDELRKHGLGDVIHTLEGCVEDVTHNILSISENTNCTIEKISSHGEDHSPHGEGASFDDEDE